ncbi:MAG: hypothetical protein Udaeo_11210 [Candidatus Udaeobacter sp.]|nr:MAG: hypothetical protein Udaeo_11210 [Candidatus Udaeobacter sp.]
MQTLLDGAPDGLRRNAVRFVVLHLLGSPVFGNRNECFHALRDRVGEEHYFAVDVACRAAGCLDERSLAAQKSFLISVQNAHQRNLG